MIQIFLPFILAFMVFGSAHAQTVPAAPPSPPPVVLELFTSQGCAFCPPADELMGQMVGQEGVIGLSCHVDYFGVRKNSLGKSFCTKRQSEYNRLIGKGPRFTPELVINGHMDMVGYETGKISAAVLKARAEKIRPVEIKGMGKDLYNIVLPEISWKGGDIRLWLAVYDTPHVIGITEGRNYGKKLTYYNVVSDLKDLGIWNGRAETREVQVKSAPMTKGLALIAQDAKTGRVLAAGKTEGSRASPPSASAKPFPQTPKSGLLAP